MHFSKFKKEAYYPLWVIENNDKISFFLYNTILFMARYRLNTTKKNFDCKKKATLKVLTFLEQQKKTLSALSDPN